MAKINYLLLGGSSSIYKNGLFSGLKSCLDIKNIALGGSSSVQNLASFLREVDYKHITFDGVVTQSNVNDAYNCSISGVPINVIRENIVGLYETLFLSKKKVVCIILPINPKSKISRSIFDEVNEIHVKCCKEYGFEVFDVISGLGNYFEDKQIPDSLFIDNVHLSRFYLYVLGRSIGEYLLKSGKSLLKKKVSALIDRLVINKISFDVHSFSSDCAQEVKENSLFKEPVLELTSEFSIKTKSNYLVGLGTWSDGYSKLRISSGNEQCVKAFSDILSFNELCQPLKITGSVIDFIPFPKDKISEPSVLVTPAIEEKPIKLTYMLLKSDKKKINCKMKYSQYKDLTYLTPDPSGLLLSNKELLEKNQRNYLEGYVDLFRDSAILLEEYDIGKATALMKLAKEGRPEGPLIKEKIRQYSEIANKYS